jgi:hypothetical protein
MANVGLFELEDAIVALLRSEFDSNLYDGAAADHIVPHTGAEDEIDAYRFPLIVVATDGGEFVEAGSSGAQFDLTERASIKCYAATRRNRVDGEDEGDQAGVAELVDEAYRILAGTLVTLPTTTAKLELEPLNFTIGEDPDDEGFLGVLSFKMVIQMEGN